MTSASSFSGSTLASTDRPNQFVRDSDQITASEAMLVFEERPKVPQSSVPLNVVRRLKKSPQTTR